MPLRTKVQVALTLLAGALSLGWAWHMGAHNWLAFGLLVVGVLATSGLKIQLFNSDGSISLSFPFVLLGLLELQPFQGMFLAAISVAAVSRIRTASLFSAVQVAFNVSSTIVATACAYASLATLHHLRLASAPALALSSVVYFLVNTGSVALVIASSTRERFVPLWRAHFAWFLPFYVVGAILAATANWLQKSYGWANALLLLPVAYALYRAYAGQVARLTERQRHIEESEALQQRTIEGLAMAIEAKDQGTHDHLFRVRSYAQAIGERLQLTRPEMQALQTAAFLHDIGKLAVPEVIINKPGKLTPEEFEKMKIHPVVGADILERVRFPYPVVPIVRSHHEWWNGTGYPDGLKGEEIPLGARILTVVDCFDALVSDRPYRKGMTSQQALAILRGMAGKQFDPAVVAAFEQFHAETEGKEKAPETAPAGFHALNTEVEVSRGKAPGAGFESGSHSSTAGNAPVSQDPLAQQRSASPTDALPRLASASQQAHALFELGQSLGESLNRQELLALFAFRLGRWIPHHLCVVYLLHQEALHPVFSAGEAAAHFQPTKVAFGQGISGWVAESEKPLLNGNAEVEPWHAAPETTARLQSALSLPLFDIEKRPFAVLTLYSRQSEAYTREHVRILQVMEPKLSLALKNSVHEPPAQESAAVDALTGLPNANGLFLHLESALASARSGGDPLAVLVCDLNGFKDVNQRRGHTGGDRLLVQVAKALRELCAAGETVARTGGDEFVLVLPGATAQPAADRILSVAQTVAAISRRAGDGARRAGEGASTAVSAAAALFPADGGTPEELLAAASRRMCREKQQFYSDITARSFPVTKPEALATCVR